MNWVEYFIHFHLTHFRSIYIRPDPIRPFTTPNFYGKGGHNWFWRVSGGLSTNRPKSSEWCRVWRNDIRLAKKNSSNIFEDSSLFGGEEVKNRSQSNYFSTSCLINDMEVELIEPMRDFRDEEQGVFILKFDMSRRQNDIPCLRTKNCNMWHSSVYFCAFLPSSHEHHRNFNWKLGR